LNFHEKLNRLQKLADLNRNYGYNWAYTHPGQLGQAGSNFAGNAYYRGTAAWSERGTRAIRDLCNARRFTSAFNYHAWDDSFNYPWNYDIGHLTSDDLKFKAIADYCTLENKFQKGTFNQTLGYTANGTSDDWMYGEQSTKGKIFSFTIEVGKSFYPAQSLILTYCDSLLQANIKMHRMAATYAAIWETGSDTINSLSPAFSFDIRRYSIKDANFTVSLIPLDARITSVGSPVVYNYLSFLEGSNGTIPYTISPLTANGTILKYVIQVDNGTWSYTDTISKVFMGHSVLPIGCDDSDEPNNTKNQASCIFPGTIAKAAASSGEDDDWYFFQTTGSNTNCRVVLSNLPADYDMEIFNAAGKRAGASTNPFKINDTIVVNNGKDESYWVRVYGYKKAYHPFHCYSLGLQLDSGMYPLPINHDSKDKQTGNMIVHLSPVPAKDRIIVSVNSSSSQSVSWYLSDNMGRGLKNGGWRLDRGISQITIQINELPSGFYTLHLSNASTGYSRVMKFVIQQ
jgi:hypothetical protein